MTIPLTLGFVAVVDAEDYSSVASLKWAAATSADGSVFAIHRFRDAAGREKSVSMHRFLMAAAAGRRIYHQDGDRLNNSRQTNLRVRPAPSTTVKRKNQGRRYRGITMTPWGTYRVLVQGKYKGSAKTL